MKFFTHALVATTVAMAMGMSAPATSAAQDTEMATQEPAVISVQNLRQVPVTVFVDQGDFDIRLGSVAASGTAVLTLPPWMAREEQEVQIFARPEGGHDLASDRYEIEPGSKLELAVQAGVVDSWQPSSEDTMSVVLDPADSTTATLTVENPRDENVTIYIEQGDFDTRIGTVMAGHTRTLRLPDRFAVASSSIRIFVDPDGGFDLNSTLLDVSPGAHLALTVPTR